MHVELCRTDLQDRVREMHEIVPAEVARFIKTSTLSSALLLALPSTQADRARAQATAPHDSAVAGRSLDGADPAASDAAPYCPEPKLVTALATTKGRFPA